MLPTKYNNTADSELPTEAVNKIYGGFHTPPPPHAPVGPGLGTALNYYVNFEHFCSYISH